MNKEQQQELFNYLYNELGVTALESNLHDIEDIINPRIFPYVDSDKPAPRKLTEQMNNKTILKKWELELEKLRVIVADLNSSTAAYAKLSSKYQQLQKCIIELKETVQENV